MKDGENETYHEWLARTSAPPPMPPDKVRHKGTGVMIVNVLGWLLFAIIMAIGLSRCEYAYRTQPHAREPQWRPPCCIRKPPLEDTDHI